jgi:hypothetical protein
MLLKKMIVARICVFDVVGRSPIATGVDLTIERSVNKKSPHIHAQKIKQKEFPVI